MTYYYGTVSNQESSYRLGGFMRLLSLKASKEVIKQFNIYFISDLYDWLQSLAVYGVAIIKNAPHDTTVVRQLANRIGFIKRTTYG